MKLLVEAIIIKCSLNIKGERTNSSIYHILQGKKSIQTVQDIHMYQLESYYGIFRSLTKGVFDKKINGLINEGMLQQVFGTEAFYTVSKTGEEWLDQQKKSNSMINYFNGLNYYGVTDVFIERLILLIQTITNTKMNHFNFIPVIDKTPAENWVKNVYQKKKTRETEVLETIFNELKRLLHDISDEEAEMFVDRLTGYKNYGMNIYQLAAKYDFTSEDVQLQLTGITHRLLDLIHRTKSDFPFMSYILRDISAGGYLTNSADKTHNFFKSGFSIEEIAQVRQLKENTIYDHIVEIALYDLNFPISHFVNEANQEKIIKAVRSTKSYKLKDIKQLVDEDITYFQIRLVLAHSKNLQKQVIK